MRNHQTQIILQGRTASRLLLVLLLGFVFVACSVRTSDKAASNEVNSPVVRLTWMSIANWLVEVGDLRIVINGYITRTCDDKPRSQRRCNRTIKQVPNLRGIKTVLKALGNGDIDFILVDHSHVDHSFDAATWSYLTKAKIIGSETTCLQAIAQGISEDKCRIIDGKKKNRVVRLSDELTVRVVHWHHGDWKNPNKPKTPKVLTEEPDWNPNTGIIPSRANFPNGGGAMAFLFTLKISGKTLSWFYGGARGFPRKFNDPVCINDECAQMNFGRPKLNLIEALKETELTESGVDLYIANGRNSEWAKKVVPFVKPKYYIPHHWDRRQQLFDGMPYDFAEATNVELEDSNDTCSRTKLERHLKEYKYFKKFLPQKQYMDAFEINSKGEVTRVRNDEVKKQLGLAIEAFPNRCPKVQ